ncbi:hypothetical protein D3C72_2342330 [compost metagenome]
MDCKFSEHTRAVRFPELVACSDLGLNSIKGWTFRYVHANALCVSFDEIAKSDDLAIVVIESVEQYAF